MFINKENAVFLGVMTIAFQYIFFGWFVVKNREATTKNSKKGLVYFILLFFTEILNYSFFLFFTTICWDWGKEHVNEFLVSPQILIYFFLGMIIVVTYYIYRKGKEKKWFSIEVLIKIKEVCLALFIAITGFSVFFNITRDLAIKITTGRMFYFLCLVVWIVFFKDFFKRKEYINQDKQFLWSLFFISTAVLLTMATVVLFS